MIFGHKKQWQFLKNKFATEQLSHSYLFAGQEGIGKKTFAKEFIKFINCLGDKKPCNNCQNCKAIESNNFPDFLLISPEETNEITISQIRAAQKFLSYKPYYNLAFKAVIIDQAEKMNQEAQNCFLKTLEEPKGKTLLFLISSRPDMVLPTIYSRCQQVKFFKPKDLPENKERAERQKEILKELMPVLNSSFAEKFKYAKSVNFEKQNLSEITDVLQKYLRNLLLKNSGIELAESQKHFSQMIPALEKYSVLKIKKIIELIQEINFKTSLTNASPKLALEVLLMDI